MEKATSGSLLLTQDSLTLDIMDGSFSILEGGIQKLDVEIPGILHQLLQVTQEQNGRLRQDLLGKEDQIAGLHLVVEELEGRIIRAEERGEKTSSPSEKFRKEDSRMDEISNAPEVPRTWTEESQEWYDNLERIVGIFQGRISSLETLLEEKERSCLTLGKENRMLEEKLEGALASEKKLLQEKLNSDVDITVMKMASLDIVQSEQNQDLRIKIQEYEHLLSQKQEVVAKMAEDLALTHSNLTSCRESELELRNGLDRKNLEMAEYLAREGEYRSEIGIIQDKLERSEGSEEELKECLLNKVVENECLKMKLEQVLEKMKRLETVESDLEERKEEIAAHFLREEDLVHQVKFLEEELALAHSRINGLKLSESALKEELVRTRLEIGAFLEREEQSKSELNILRKKLDVAKASEQQLNQELWEITADNENLKADLVLAVEKIHNFKIIQSELKQQLQAEMEANESLEKNRKELQAEISKLQKTSENKIYAVSKEKEELQLVHRLSNIRTAIIFNELQQKNVRKEAAQSELHNNILEGLQLRMQELQQELQAQENTNKGLNVQLSNALKELEEVHRVNSWKQQELLELENQVAGLKTETAELANRRSAAKKEHQKLKSEIESLKELLIQAEKRVKEEIEESNRLKSKVLGLQDKLKAQEAEETIVQELRAQITLLEKKNQQYQEDIKLIVEGQKLKDLTPKKTKDAAKIRVVVPGKIGTPVLKANKSKSKTGSKKSTPGKFSVPTRRTPVKRGRTRKTKLDKTLELSSDSDTVSSSTSRRPAVVDSPNINLSMITRASSKRQKIDPKKIYTPYPN